jgi:O-antigen/teichoic acid export membrane protein
LRSAAFVYLLASLLNRLSAVVLIPIYTRRLTLTEYGDYALALTIVTFVSSIFALGLPAAVSRFYFEGGDREAAERRSGSVARANTIIVVTWLGVSWLGAYMLAPAVGSPLLNRHAILCMATAASGAAVGYIPLVFLRAAQRPYFVAILQFTELLLSTCFGLVFVVVLGRGRAGTLEALAASGAVNGAVAIGFVWFRLRGKLDARLLGEAIRFSWPFLVHALTNWAQAAGDRWVLKLDERDADVGRIALAAQLTQPAALPAAALAEAELARVGEAYRYGGMAAVRDDLPSARLRYLASAAVPSAVIVAGLPVIRVVLGQRAAEGTLILIPLLCAATLIDSQFYPYQLVVYYALKSRWMIFVNALTIVTSFSLLFLLVPKLGAFGAVAARVAGALARSGAMWLAARICIKRSVRP